MFQQDMLNVSCGQEELAKREGDCKFVQGKVWSSIDGAVTLCRVPCLKICTIVRQMI